MGSFLFAGPTGVGKTEICKQLSRIMGVKLLRFDMSEYMERHAISKLIGSPPGYVGYDEGGLLTEAVNSNPYAVLLLDEIEKRIQIFSISYCKLWIMESLLMLMAAKLTLVM